VINNQKVVDLFLEIFWNDYNLAVPYDLDTMVEDTYGDTGTYIPKFDPEVLTVSPKYLPMFAPEGVYYHLKKLIRRAKHFIYLYIPYASTTVSHVVKLLDELGNATLRGVTVLAITNDYDTKVALENRGINVIYTPSDLASLHAKAMIVDDKIIFLGSSNWSSTGLGVRYDSNREAGIAIMSINVTVYFRDVFGYDWERKTGTFDSDGDGLCDIYEQNNGLDTADTDSDNDGYSDWEEVVVYDSDPLDPNSPGLTPPNVEIIVPENGSNLNTSTVYVQWNATDPDGIDYCEVKLDDGSWINVGATDHYTFYGVSDGFHTIYVRAYDTLGASNTTNVNITVSAPPNVVFNDPVSGSSSGYEIYSAFGMITIGWSASDNSGVDHSEVRIDEGAWIYIGNVSCYEITGLSEGNHTIEIKVVDVNGNYNLSTINIVVDYTPPNVYCDERYAMNAGTSSIVISWSGSDNVGIEYYLVKIGSNPWTYVGTNTSITMQNDLPDGIHTVYIKAVDKAGNYNLIYTTLLVDKSTPTIDVVCPSNNSYMRVTTISISWSVQDNNSVYSSIRIDGGAWIYLGRATSYEATLSEGQHEIEIMAKDDVENTNNTKIVITIDITPPSLNITNPMDGEVIEYSSITIQWECQDNEGIAYYLIKIDDNLWIKTTNASYTCGLGVGSHTITVRVVDLAGNTDEEIIVIYVDSGTSSGSGNRVSVNSNIGETVQSAGRSTKIVWKRRIFLMVYLERLLLISE